MSGAWQHTIPQFFLEGFTSRMGRNGSLTWICRRGGPAREDLIKRIAAEYYFYSKSREPDLDDLITKLEGESYATLVRELRKETRSTALLDPRLAELAIHLYLRTQHIRAAFARFMVNAVEEIREFLSHPRNITRATLGPYSQEQIIKNRQERGLSRAAAKIFIRQQGPALSAEYVSSHSPEIAKSFERTIIGLESTIKNAHIEALLKDPSAQIHSHRYAGWNWYLLLSPAPLILGDSVLIYEFDHQQRPFGSFPTADSNLVRIWMPVAADRVLVASPSLEMPSFVPSLLNQAIARCSVENLISSVHVGDELLLQMGEWTDIMSKKKFDSIVMDFKRSFYRGRSKRS